MAKQGPNLAKNLVIGSGGIVEVQPPFKPIPGTIISDVYWYAEDIKDNSIIVPVHLVCKKPNSDQTLLTIFHNQSGRDAMLYIFLTFDYV